MTTPANEFQMFFDDARRRRILRAVIEAYYAEAPTDGVVFETNRAWTARMPMLLDMYPSARVICCVREVGWIIDSIERMLSKNPLQTSRLFNFEAGSSIYARVETLMNSDKGLVGGAWSGLREAWFGDHASRLIVVDYDKLAQDPRRVLRALYDALELSWFEHDFDNVAYDEPEYDSLLGMPGMHKVAKKVEFIKRPPSIPPDIFAKYADLSFWNNPEYSKRGVRFL